MMYFNAILSLLLIFFAILIAAGKGDMLIAGYNTASEQERKKVNIKRLRMLTAILLGFAVVFLMVMPLLGNSTTWHLIATGAFLTIAILFIILANTWAKNKIEL